MYDIEPLWQALDADVLDFDQASYGMQLGVLYAHYFSETTLALAVSKAQ